jgi:c-di-GMP-binding flagellar brake protein YcgR
MGSRDNRKVFRVKLEKPLKVEMGSIGADIKYDLVTNDISPNGFFLDFESPGRFPFNPSSIMEVWLTLSEDNQIFFNGKMARVVYPPKESGKPGRPGIAIRIVQIDPDQEKKLLEFIEEKGNEKENKTFDDEPEIAV